MECPSVSGFGNQEFGAGPFGASWTNPHCPNLTDFESFVYNNMEIPVAALPLGSQWPGFAFAQAKALVPWYPTVVAVGYVLAVYNCAGHILLKITPDQTGGCFFKDNRAAMKLNEPEIGIIQSSSDEGTSNSFVIGDQLKNLTIGDLSFMRTPYGREYLAYAGDAGPGIWGLS
jgi:hypothetical protein